ncbi:MAG: cytochrome c-type biogenesis protein CcmH [Rhodospirillaceae bacterium]|jgi:cytochrome c-type biogenesis protein CcmH|nr:cytochrome c-type biogenesis protein CcmH [Pseudomonadota bacterium]MBT7452141.1 cytochrome c-type biogenesis protein CcmH [Rhodospirillaceae bacterium]MBT8005632.1 cytochrome c-type biogenesis protein CcmH [Rhodospirillales bacterium]
MKTVIFLLFFLVTPALAIQPDEILEDKVLEERARVISKELRCLVCQNQSIDDSDAPLAKDLRVLVRERLQAGESDEKVIEFVADRYGDFVLLRPPVKASTLTLWISPIVILIVGVIFLLMRFRKQEKNMPVKVPPLSSEETKKLEAALGEDKR